MRKLLALVVVGCLAGAAADAEARDNIKIVGSSTVYPFTVAVINELEKSRGLDVDIIGTGTGGGFLLFCTGAGDTWPDLTGASRPMKDYERKRCARNGVEKITEIKIGFDGIVVANAVEAPAMSFTRKDLFLALATKAIRSNDAIDNPARQWRDVNADLPDSVIKVIGPPPSSGTRDSFEGFVMQVGCSQIENLDVVEEEDQNEFCSAIRGEPQYMEGGEDDQAIVERLKKEPSAFGVFGYSFVVNNPDMVKANAIDGVLPSAQTITDGSYPLARPLYLYVKDERLDDVPALKKFLSDYISEAAIGPEGYLAKRGLVPLTDDERAKSAAKVRSLTASN